ncbi:MAG TPA: glycosyltransferase family 2 protein [Pseudomonadales bacterium]|nr:glycosyltransferase family 2 protein [Pseudomonadales bacterium]
MTAPTVAVVVVNYNGGGYLLRCLEAVAAQSRQADHVIVVDNASTDDSLVLARERFPHYRYLVNAANDGFAAANNRAFALCAELGVDYVALLNPDAFASRGWLMALLDAADGDDGCASWASCLVRADVPSEIDGLGDSYHLSGAAWRRHHGRTIRSEWLVDRDVFCACAAAALYRFDAVRRVGGFDEDLFCYLEDVDLGFRLRLLGYRCRFVSKARVEHVGSGITGYRSTFATYYGQRNLIWVFAKNMPTRLVWALLPLHIAFNLSMLVVCALRGQFVVALQAKWDALKGLARQTKKRRVVQADDRAPTGAIWRAMNKSLVHGS